MLLDICFPVDKPSPLSSSSQGEALAQAFLVEQNRSTRTWGICPADTVSQYVVIKQALALSLQGRIEFGKFCYAPYEAMHTL